MFILLSVMGSSEQLWHSNTNSQTCKAGDVWSGSSELLQRSAVADVCVDLFTDHLLLAAAPCSCSSLMSERSQRAAGMPTEAWGERRHPSTSLVAGLLLYISASHRFPFPFPSQRRHYAPFTSSPFPSLSSSVCREQLLLSVFVT